VADTCPQAERTIVEKRSVTYDIPPELRSKFTDKDIADLKLHFSMFDVDGGGSIEAEELKQVLGDMGLEPTDEQIRDIILEVDKDRSGAIEFNEFVTLMYKVSTPRARKGRRRAGMAQPARSPVTSFFTTCSGEHGAAGSGRQSARSGRD
jgi:hypothetical protein